MHPTEKVKSKSDYEASMKQGVDSLKVTTPIEGAHLDSVISVLYEEYKQEYLNLGGTGKWTEALPIVLACEAIFLGDLPPKEEADLIYNIGYIYDKCAQYFQALDYFHRSIERYEAINGINDLDVRNDIALAYNNIGVTHAHTGFFTQRKESYLKAKELWESIDDVDKSYLIALYGNLLRLYQQYGDKQAAEELIITVNQNFERWMAEGTILKGEKLDDLAKPKTFYRVEKHRLNILYADLISDKAGGLAHLDSLRTHFMQMNMDDQRQFSPYWLSSISHASAPLTDYIDFNERRQKKQYLDLGMRESIRLGDHYNQMIFHSRLVSYHLDAEQNREKALSHLEQAIQIGHQINIREFNLLNLYLKKGDVLQQIGRFPEAEKLVFKSISMLLGQPVTDPAVLQIKDFAQRNDIFYVKALKQTARLYKNEFENNNDPVYGRLAQHFYNLTAELFHIYYQKGPYNPQLDLTNAAINEGLLSLYPDLGDTDETTLINLIENNRSQHLAKEFEAKYQRFLHIPDSLFSQRNLLQTEMIGYEQVNKNWGKAYEALHTAWMEVDAKIQQADDQYLSFFGGTFDIQAVQSELQEQECIVRYVVAEKNIYAYIIWKDDLTIVQLGAKEALLPLTKLYHETIQNKQKDYYGLATRLYAELIDPLKLPLEKIKNLVIIPDNSLNYIPFETLIHSESKRSLVASCPVSYSHGLHLWLMQRKSPVSIPGQQYFAAFAPQYSADYMSSFANNHPTTRNRLQDIAGATQEAEQIAQHFDGHLFRGDQATKHDFLQRATAYKIYHFAMHALLDESNHLNSSLVFQDEEHLFYHELYGLHFPAELVVLSACNTGMGKLENGEGLMSLSRALTYAGVRSSVYSLWEVPDEETAEIMFSFYKQLKSGHSKAEALTLAKRQFLANNPMKSHPFFWAGFIINGNTDSLNDATFTYKYIWLVLGMTVMALLLLLRRKA